MITIGNGEGARYIEGFNTGYDELYEQLHSVSDELVGEFTTLLSQKMQERDELEPSYETMRDSLVLLFLPTFVPKDEAGKVKKLRNLTLSGGTTIPPQRAVIGDIAKLKGLGATMIELVDREANATIIDIFRFPSVPDDVLRIVFPVFNDQRSMEIKRIQDPREISSRNKSFKLFRPVYFFMTLGRGK